MPNEIAITDIAQLQDGYSVGRYTPLDVIEEVNRRIEVAGDDHVWIVRLSKEEMARRAEELDGRKSRAAAGKLPLYGVPFAVKDNMDVEGLPTTAGCPDFSYVAQQTAPVVRRLLDAGGILVGKTNLDQFATGLTGARSPYGVPQNPYDKDYIPGGSSSGSAVAVASGLVSFALGTDTAGSGRVPAGFNNIVGLKPTRGLLSISGIVPACRSLDCVAIFAMDTHFAEAVMDVAAAPDITDAFSRDFPRQAPVVCKIGILRSGDRQFYGDDGAAAVYQSGVERLQRLGFVCQDIDFGPFREAAEMLYNGPWMAERDVAVGDFIRRNPESVVEVTRNAIMSASRFSAADAFKAYYRIKELRVAARATWSEVDAIFVPTTPTIYRVDEVLKDPAATNGRLSHYTNFVNLLDLCAVAVPSGFTANGLPVGATLIAPAFHDRGVIVASRTYMAAAENRGRIVSAACRPVRSPLRTLPSST